MTACKEWVSTKVETNFDSCIGLCVDFSYYSVAGAWIWQQRLKKFIVKTNWE